ncbi:hypothetical protein EGR_07153 [Echinococcus granulosus]|uniref:COX assembly mitochondrial protein n=1 Tax=Echinococcus granulosus TaxID=6210 RepID=W6UBP3_ECHGR|nr:hypothetical protein EGR_07153 [Echinococcus granulosus]EUB57961.1 hypothetical protein EGR_07153 [Echinococcus granulosus]
MGSYIFKSDTLDFAVLPSEKIEGPLGLGFPEDESLNRVEKETLIPALCMQHARKTQCAQPWEGTTPFNPHPITTSIELAECARRWHWVSVAICRRQFDAAMGCTKQHLLDPEFQEQMRKHYLELRATYRSTGIEPRF